MLYKRVLFHNDYNGCLGLSVRGKFRGGGGRCSTENRISSKVKKQGKKVVKMTKVDNRESDSYRCKPEK